MIQVGGGNDKGPIGVGKFEDGSGDCFVGVKEGFFECAPSCTSEGFVYFDGFVSIGFGVFVLV